MVGALKQTVTVQQGGRIEIRSAELKPGLTAEVIVLFEQAGSEHPAAPKEVNPFAILLNAPKGCFSTADEIDAFIRSERDAWES